MTKTWVYFLVAALSVLVIDQVTKQWAVQNGIATINAGIAFGAFSNVNLVGLVVPLVFFLLAGIWMQKFIPLHPVITGIFFGAAVSNFVDRWRFGGVVDWLPVPVVALQNNIADWAIVLSLAVLTVHMITSQKKQNVT